MHEDLIVVKATSAQVREAQIRSSSSWGKNMSLDQYLDREKSLNQTQLSKESLTHWVLVSSKDPTSIEFKCACKSFQRPALIIQPNSNKLQDVISHGIASVFCPLKYRHNGYSTTMMRKLASKFYSDNVAFSYLYSDVGQFYQQSGWYIPNGANREIKIPVGEDFFNKYNENLNSLHLISTLEEVDLIADYDVQLIREEMNLIALKKSNNKPVICVLPIKQGYRWNAVRSSFYQNVINPKIQLSNYGATIDKNNFILWTTNAMTKLFIILRLRSTNSKITMTLINAAHKEAKKLGLEYVVIWVGSHPYHDEGLLKDLDLNITERKTALPAIAYFLQDGLMHDIEWYVNENALWC